MRHDDAGQVEQPSLDDDAARADDATPRSIEPCACAHGIDQANGPAFFHLPCGHCFPLSWRWSRPTWTGAPSSWHGGPVVSTYFTGPPARKTHPIPRFPERNLWGPV